MSDQRAGKLRCRVLGHKYEIGFRNGVGTAWLICLRCLNTVCSYDRI